MSQIRKNIRDVIDIIQSTTELFYQQKTAEGYAAMDQTIGAIGQVVESLHQYKQTEEGFDFDEARVAASLTEALEAMEQKDTVLLADVLEYDFVEYLKELEETLG